MKQIVRWPLREAVLTFYEHLRAKALDDYKFQILAYAISAPYAKGKPSPPELPKILKG